MVANKLLLFEIPHKKREAKVFLSLSLGHAEQAGDVLNFKIGQVEEKNANDMN